MKEGRRKAAGRGRKQMPRNIDVLAEMRKFADRKPVHAVAGATVLASRTLRELPWRLVQWTRDNPPNSLPGRATEAAQSAQSRAMEVFQTAQSRANGAVQSAQSRANGAVQSAQSRANGAVQTAQSRANGAVQTAQSRATGAVQTARAKASDGYDTLAAHGKKAMNGESDATQDKSTASAQSKAELNGKPKAKAPTRSTTSR
jgi:cell division septum initiation protein DivIVA